jgi:hypothetical protein
MPDMHLERSKIRERELLSVAKSALREVRGTNIMGGCSACGSERRRGKYGRHSRYNCIVLRLERAIAAYSV